MDIKKASELFWVTFTGEYVELLCKYETTEHVPLVIQAYLLDIDNDYYYVGENALEVDSAVKKSDVAFISIIKQKDAVTEMLENMPTPESEEETN